MDTNYRRGWSIKDFGDGISKGVETVVDAVSGAKWHNPVKSTGNDFVETGKALLDIGDDFLSDLGSQLIKFGEDLVDAAKNDAKGTVLETLRVIERWWKQKWREAKSYYEKKLDNAYTDFIKKYVDTDIYNDIQKQYAEAIGRVKDFINNLNELLNIKKLIQKILDQAETMLEDYLREKLCFLKTVESKGEPDIEISLDDTTLQFEMYIYVVKDCYTGVDYKGECYLELSLNIEQDITTPKPKADFKMKFYDERIKADLKERLEKKMNEEKDKLAEELVTALFSDYLTVFKQFKEYLDLI